MTFFVFDINDAHVIYHKYPDIVIWCAEPPDTIELIQFAKTYCTIIELVGRLVSGVLVFYWGKSV